ncbi:hypothetical protein ZIOFF_051781 [Zingiber officinale]|uniref:ENHANCER OF AG-4 protein 2 n=1 Tax=Zingiber officinale TaxID=94328 RepID=A0A8J5FMH3_ZINOF|nr:hypothetical protein ZIOFF_051781 [Zingiber officinale]
MAPGRRKGSNRVKAVGQLKLGDLVLAKVKGYPAWPAKISRPEDFERSPDPRKYFVQFFGTSEIAFVVPADIQVFTDESRIKLTARCQSKTVKHFASAVDEICEAFEELNKKRSAESVHEADMINDSVASPLNSDFEDIEHPVEHNGATHLRDPGKKVENNVSGEPPCINFVSRSQEVSASLDPSSSNLNGAESLLKRKKSSTNDGQIAKKKKVVVYKSDLYSSSCKEKSIITSPDDSEGTNMEILPQFEIEEPLPKVSSFRGLENSCDSNEKDASCSLRVQKNVDIVAKKKKVLVSKSSLPSSGKKNKSVSGSPDEINGTDMPMLSNMEPKGSDHDNLDNCSDMKDANKEIRGLVVMKKKVAVSKSTFSASSSKEKLMNTNPDDIKNENMIMSPPKKETEEPSPIGSEGGLQDYCDSNKGDISNSKVQEVGHQTTKGDTEPKQNVDNASGIKSNVAVQKQLKGNGKGNNLPVEKGTKVTSNDSNRVSARNTTTGSNSKTGKMPKSLKKPKEYSLQNGKPHNNPRKATTDTSYEYANDKSVPSGEVENFKGRSKMHKFKGSNDSCPTKGTKLVKEDVNKSKKSMHGDLPPTDELKYGTVEKRKKSGISIRSENQLTSATNMDAHLSTVKHAEDMDAMAHSAIKITANLVQSDSKLVKKRDRPLSTHIRYKRRSCRFDDDDEEEETKTPIHKASSVNLVLSDSSVSVSEQKLQSVTESNKDSPTNRDATEKACLSSDQKSSYGITLLAKVAEKNERKAEKSHSPQTYQSPMKREYQKSCFGGSRTPLLSPKASASLDDAPKLRDQTCVKPHVKAFDSPGKKSQITPSKLSKSQSEGLNSSTSQSMPEKIKALNKSINMKAPSKSNAHNTVLTENKHEKRFSSEWNSGKDTLGEKRSGMAKEEKLVTISASSFSDTSKSMRNLIAAAQAKKRREEQSRYVHPENSIPIIVSTPNLIHGMSPSPAVLIPFTSANLFNKDIEAYAAIPSDSPSSVPHESSLSNKVDHEEYEHRISPEYRPPGGSLSGGTEAAVARDALEGMVETLSRTKDSIGRATRLAIDCAKYGIADEIVELLIQKLENEPSFHRRVDLFFLVDSITQCSHTQKGIAGSSYIPTVQAALPRLLSAAAPSGASARENRRQCLKVLKLWLERKIMPDSLLRRYINEIEVPSDDLSAGIFLRRPSRAERSVDDPIREIEDMLVDEYGSNATFQLPGLLSCNVFEDEEDLYVDLYGDSGIKMSAETASKLGHLDTGAVTPSDRHPHILKDVDGELEMEDVILPKEEKGIASNNFQNSESQPCDSSKSSDLAVADSNELPPLPTAPPPPVESPPLPPSPPPLPPSPPPPPPPLPSSPTPPPLPLSGQLCTSSVSLPPAPSSSSPSLFYPSTQEEFRLANCNQVVHLPNNTVMQGQEAALSNEMVLQQRPNFMANGISNTQSMNTYSSSRPFEYGQNESYLAPQTSHNSHHFQQGNAPFHQRPYHSLPHAPTAAQTAGHFSHATPMSQQQVQQQHNHYPLPSVPNSHRQYLPDEQRRVHTRGFSPDNQHSAWVPTRPSCSGAPITQDGFPRSNIEMAPSNSMGYQLPLHNSVPSAGHSFPQVLPGRPDISGVNCWRPDLFYDVWELEIDGF